jgi:hypothetical protein
MKFESRMLRRRTAFIAAAFLFPAVCSWAQNEGTAAAIAPNAVQIVQALERHDRMQAEALEHYRAFRHYEIEYWGFFRDLTAQMDVEFEYDSASGKTFRVISESGSHALCERVLKRAIDSEREAFQDRIANALSAANYKFQLLGSESLDGRPSYVLQVDPLSANAFLYRGKIWVDAADFAVSKLDVQPAQNPSVWISQTLIHHRNSRVGSFWLPEENQSITKVRIGGRAVMTIRYGPYQILQSQSAQAAGETVANRAVLAR